METSGKFLGKWPRTTKIELQENDMATISKKYITRKSLSKCKLFDKMIIDLWKSEAQKTDNALDPEGFQGTLKTKQVKNKSSKTKWG